MSGAATRNHVQDLATGDVGTGGKTSFMNRVVEDTFSFDTRATIGVNFYKGALRRANKRKLGPGVFGIRL